MSLHPELEVKYHFDTEPVSAENPPLLLDAQALLRAREFATQPQYRGKRLRVYLSAKGCDGFLYDVNFDDVVEEGDFLWEQDSFPLVIDAAALKIIRHATVRFVETPEGSGFVVDNPYGERFTGKFWKRPGDIGPLPEPVIGARTPLTLFTEEGKYLYCTCGLSKRGVECDGSHGGTGFQPLEATVTESKTISWCQCRHSRNLPFCDGTHCDLK